MTIDAYNPLTQHNIVEFLADIFTRRGSEEYLGEPVTMAEHMLQGAHFADQDGESDLVIVAALLHDIGHFTSEFGMFSMADTTDKYHETAGAQVLEPFFPNLIIDCVRFHVAAKRYLCATDPEYFGELSSASIHSLNLQGGPMDTSEVAEFEKLNNLEKIVRVRRYDDAGKQAGLKTPDFNYFMPKIQAVVDQHLQTS